MTTHAKFFQKHTQNDSLYHNSTYNMISHSNTTKVLVNHYSL